ncbi:hypothetical protein, partial [Oribacterium sp. oral taxon 078]|uniref:hypothetical protein n=1 Tax=Oribacterium sp. oral taxon 078 TaxID=652706 RepID=UPI001A99B480
RTDIPEGDGNFRSKFGNTSPVIRRTDIPEGDGNPLWRFAVIPPVLEEPISPKGTETESPLLEIVLRYY